MDEAHVPRSWAPVIERTFRMSRVLTIAFMASSVILLGVFFIVFTSPESGAPPAGPAPTPVVVALWGVVLAGALAAPAIRDWLATSVNSGSPARALVTPGEGEGEYADGGRSAADAGALLTASILGLAFCELPLLVGFVLGILAGSAWPMLQGAVLSLGLYAFMWPRRSTWERWLAKRAERAGAPMPYAASAAEPTDTGVPKPPDPIEPT